MTTNNNSLFEDTSELLNTQIQELIQKAFQTAFPDSQSQVKIEYPADSSHGDYASNIALQTTKELQIPPREVAQKISEAVEKGDLIEKLEIAGPGFINIFVSEKHLNAELEKITEDYGKLNLGAGKNIIVEYSQPNIAKPLGVHHLLSTVIGQAIANLCEHAGFKTMKTNYIGDWGTQFGKLIYAYKEWGNREVVEKDPIAELLKLYVKFHKEAEEDANLEDKGRYEFKIFEEGDEENRELWKWIVEESLREIQKTYDKLGGIKFDNFHGEGYYAHMTDEMLADGKEKGIFEVGKEGAFVVNYEDENIPPFVVQKKDGSTLYSTRDFCALKYRIENYDPAKVLYVVDVAQSLHFQQIFEASKRFDWYNGTGEHIVFGRMQMKDAKMSTRKGTVVLLDEVLDEAEERALKILEEKNPGLQDKERVAHVVGIGAIKYNILSQNRNTNITFDWDRMLSFEGNSAPYIQYSYARGRSILRKAAAEAQKSGDSSSATSSPSQSSDNNPEETQSKTAALIRLFPKFQEKIALATQEYKPNILSNYLYELAQTFNSFYNSVPVLKATPEEKQYRLKIIAAATQIIKNGLSILGIEVVEEM